jgi:hypothetical protein
MSRWAALRLVAIATCLGCASGADAPASASPTDEGSTDLDAGINGSGGVGAGGAGGANMGIGSGLPTFTRVWNEILVRKTCSSMTCHGAGIGNLQMDTQANAYLNLVGIPAAGPMCATSGKIRVVPGDPDNSLMLDKISHSPPSCGGTMPMGAKVDPACISAAPAQCDTQPEIMLVHDWIAAGAMND